ncbi:fungal-specific transcription factor domain-containing protein [Aspergillus cavernicola]|uniref:Fungal-specific transcription factor domain-containing protein n=1 Tax=Aspergillus cavernicola TaxID=176166 RepID=A0ABR4J1D0_9EURO
MSTVQSKLFVQTVVSQTTTLVFPLAARSFVDRMLSSAMETPHLLYALLASSDGHNARRTAPTQFKNTTLEFTNNAIAGLRVALADPRNAHKVEMAVTAMALCTNDICDGHLDFFRVHLAGVREMVSGFLGPNIRHDPLAIYLFKWFAALDVSAGLSLFHSSSINGGLYEASRAVFRSSQGYVDDICGYSLELLPILAEIGNLARVRYDQLQLPALGSDVHVLDMEDIHIVSQANAIEMQIMSLSKPKVSASILDGHEEELAEELRNTHAAFVHTALLHLHRRVKLLPKTHPIVRLDVRIILQLVSAIRPSSTVNILLLWPIFSAGCESDDLTERTVIDERMSIMQSLGMGNFTRARNVLQGFWDAGTDLRWDVYLAQLGVDLVLF